MKPNSPVMQTDLIIIKNKRIELEQAAGKSVNQTLTSIEPFVRTTRGYLISDEGQLVLAFNPRTINVLTLVEAIVDLDLPVEPLEYWVLVDDKVNDCGEVYDDKEPAYLADKAARRAHQFETLDYAHMLSRAVHEAMATQRLITVGFDDTTPAPVSNHPPTPQSTSIFIARSLFFQS